MVKVILAFIADQNGGLLLECALVAAMLGAAFIDALVSRGPSMSGELSGVATVAK